MKQMRRLLIDAVTKIENACITFNTRRLYKNIIFYESAYVSLKWTKPAKNVEIIGDMTDPPWIARLKMDYCKLRHIFVKYFARLKSGIYYYNYIVDGEICIAADQPSVSHMGIQCNVLKIADQPSGTIKIPRAFSKDYSNDALGWNELRRTWSESNIEFFRQQPAFQAGDFIESSDEYDLLKELQKAEKRQHDSKEELKDDAMYQSSQSDEYKGLDPILMEDFGEFKEEKREWRLDIKKEEMRFEPIGKQEGEQSARKKS